MLSTEDSRVIVSKSFCMCTKGRDNSLGEGDQKVFSVTPFVRPARTYSKGCKSLNRPDSGKVTAKGKGVRRETESEGSRRQTSGLTDRDPI